MWLFGFTVQYMSKIADVMANNDQAASKGGAVYLGLNYFCRYNIYHLDFIKVILCAGILPY